jgi:hypothetical protein
MAGDDHETNNLDVEAAPTLPPCCGPVSARVGPPTALLRRTESANAVEGVRMESSPAHPTRGERSAGASRFHAVDVVTLANPDARILKRLVFGTYP